MVRKILGILLLVAMAGCAGAYKPSDKMMQMKQGMDKQSAALIYAKYTKPLPGNSGFCGGRSFVFDEGTPLNVTVDGYSIKAYKAGELIKTEKIGSITRNLYKKIYYDASRKFSDLSKIRVTPGAVVFEACTKPGKDEMTLSLHFSASDADAVFVAAGNMDEMMAALSTLAPQAKLIEGVGL